MPGYASFEYKFLDTEFALWKAKIGKKGFNRVNTLYMKYETHIKNLKRRFRIFWTAVKITRTFIRSTIINYIVISLISSFLFFLISPLSAQADSKDPAILNKALTSDL